MYPVPAQQLFQALHCDWKAHKVFWDVLPLVNWIGQEIYAQISAVEDGRTCDSNTDLFDVWFWNKAFVAMFIHSSPPLLLILFHNN